MSDPFPPLLDRLLAGQPMAEADAHAFFDQVFSGEVAPERLAAVLTALRTRTVTADELVGFARAMRAHAHRIPAPAGVVLDNCGTGGAPRKAFNVSTTTAFLVAAAGIRVAKHGNRSFTRPSGSADILEEAGADLSLGPEAVARVLEGVGIAFLFAPTFHPAMRHAGPVRQALGVRTVFNFLGPLTNPADASHQVLGVCERELLGPMGEALARLGCQSGYVVWGEPGYDEATPVGPVHALPITDGKARPAIVVDPADLGVPRCGAEAIAPVPRAEAPHLMARLLSGEETGPRADTVVLNAAFALHAAGQADDLADGVARARDLLASGIGNAKLQAYVAATRKPA